MHPTCLETDCCGAHPLRPCLGTSGRLGLHLVTIGIYLKRGEPKPAVQCGIWDWIDVHGFYRERKIQTAQMPKEVPYLVGENVILLLMICCSWFAGLAAVAAVLLLLCYWSAAGLVRCWSLSGAL